MQEFHERRIQAAYLNEVEDGGQVMMDSSPFNLAMASALKAELGSTHSAVKTAMRWTGASERAVKYWFSGKTGPSGDHLAALVRHSDAVLIAFLRFAGRQSAAVAIGLADLRTHLVSMLREVDAMTGPVESSTSTV